MSQRMTMAQLARLAGLDVSTVSRALRGDTLRVSAPTIERVQRLARREGFLPDANAASLRRRRSYVLGMMVPDLTDVVLARLFEAVSTAANLDGYLAVVTSTRADPARRRTAAHDFLSRRVDGVIVADATLRHAAPELLVASGTPFVMALRSGGRHPSVVVDDLAGGRLAAEHLLHAGHRDLCVVGGPRNVSTAERRMRGFVQACGRAGVEIASSAMRHGAFGVDGGYRSMLELLEAGQRPSAVFAVNDYNAIGAARALQEHGLIVGRDVALTGYNDIAIGRYLETPLSTVRVDHDLMGREVVELLLRLVAGEIPESVQLQPELVVRESSDLRRGGEPLRSAAPQRPLGEETQ
ncbi:MAG TPA: LacI family DNA-binding transcriptional regulator [Acidimicrobiales bacterium]|nr:LacI family DNA-binding transcriptional regulator [Acidimicrobiales bacterium]